MKDRADKDSTEADRLAKLPTAAKFCGDCGTKLEQDEKFCGICGAKI
jgi:NADH pyrophosphatase NudC (nudix superfamily)